MKLIDAMVELAKGKTIKGPNGIEYVPVATLTITNTYDDCLNQEGWSVLEDKQEPCKHRTAWTTKNADGSVWCAECGNNIYAATWKKPPKYSGLNLQDHGKCKTKIVPVKIEHGNYWLNRDLLDSVFHLVGWTGCFEVTYADGTRDLAHFDYAFGRGRHVDPGGLTDPSSHWMYPDLEFQPATITGVEMWVNE